MWTRILTQLVMPLNLALGFLVLAWILHRFGRRRMAWALALLAVVGLAGLSLPKVADVLRRGLEDRQVPLAAARAPAADAIVVLGGCLGAAVPPRIGTDLVDASDRVLHAARLFRAGRASWIVASGGTPPGSGARQSESAAIADLLVEWGVPRASILLEEGSLDTHANAVRTQEVLQERGWKRVLLVTSALHMPRALAAFRHAGVDAVAAATDYTVVEREEGRIRDWIPSASALEGSTAALHEYLGWVYYRLRGWVE